MEVTMASRILAWLFVSCLAGTSSAVDSTGAAADTAELKAMLLALQAQISEINSTLHSQTHVDVAQVCQSLGVSLGSMAGMHLKHIGFNMWIMCICEHGKRTGPLFNLWTDVFSTVLKQRHENNGY